MRPNFMKEITILLCIFNISGYVFLDQKIGFIEFQLIFGTIVVAFSFAVIWYLWKGRNWARILVLVTSVVALLNLFSILESNTYKQIVIVGEAAFAIFLLIWLNTNPVKKFFKEKC